MRNSVTNWEKWMIGVGVVVLLAYAGVHLSLQAERRPRAARQDFVRQSFDPNDFQPHQVVDPFPAIVNPRHLPADEVNGKLQPNELVLGIELDGVTRAYPINMLTGPTREIFNDQLGEHSIAATW